MRDYAERVKALRCCSKIDARNNGCDSCPYEYCGEDCQNLCGNAADAIEVLLAASPPALWTDEPIKGTGFMAHTQGGGKGFEIHFRTDSLEKYKAVQEECRRQIDHAKAEPPKEVE